MTNPASDADIKRYRGYLQEEIDGIYIYETLANLEQDEDVRNIYTRLIATEQRHLEL